MVRSLSSDAILHISADRVSKENSLSHVPHWKTRMLVGCRRCCGRRGGWKSAPQLDRIDRVVSRTKLISCETPSLDSSTDSGLCDARSSSCAAERVSIHSRDSSCLANALAKSLTNYVFFWTRNTPITVSDACEVAGEVPAPEKPGRTFGPLRRLV
jgi:hypothetical protein